MPPVNFSSDGRTGPTLPAAPPRLLPYRRAVGVGTISPRSWRCANHLSMEGEFSFPAPVGVGSDKPAPIALVRRTDVHSSKHTPSNIKPHGGKAMEDCCQASTEKVRGIFGKDVARPYLANDSEHLEPKSRASSLQTRARSRARDILAREAPADDLHFSAPLAPVEGSDVIPHRESIKVPLRLALKQSVNAEFVDFNSAAGPPPKKLGGKDSPGAAGK